MVDVSNAPSFEDAAALAFFRGTTTNLLEAARDADVHHVVALSVVGTDRLQASGFFCAKLAQEQPIAGSGVPYTIVRATQFFEFVSTIADGYTGLPLSSRIAQHEPEPSARTGYSARSRVRCERPLYADLTSKLVVWGARRHHHRTVQPAFHL
ncbi:SDR family oxidoreductase [Sphingobium sp. PNB]|uniref:SDR family oxidoreductase n=1 Tax=Sphingobium sp. PNB TaxID=863934 RepID=UPI0039B096F2